MKIEFKNKIELIRKYQTEVLLEMHNSISQIKNSMGRLTSRMHYVTTIDSGLEDKIEDVGNSLSQ